VVGQVSLEGGNSTTGSATIRGSATVQPNSTLTVGGDVDIGGQLNISSGASVSIGGTVSVNGSLSTQSGSTLTIGGGATIEGDLKPGPSSTVFIGADTTISGSLTAPDHGTIVITGDVVIEGNLYLNADTKFNVSGGSLTILGSATIIGSGLQVSGALYVGGPFTVNGGTLSVGRFGYAKRFARTQEWSGDESFEASFDGNVTLTGAAGLMIGPTSRVTTTGHLTVGEGGNISLTLPARLLDVGLYLHNRAIMKAREQVEEAAAKARGTQGQQLSKKRIDSVVPPRIHANNCVDSNGALFLEIDAQSVEMLVRTARSTKTNVVDVFLVDSSGDAQCDGLLSPRVLATIAPSPDACSRISTSSSLTFISGRMVLTARFEVDSSTCPIVEEPQNDSSSKPDRRTWPIIVGVVVGVVGSAAIVFAIVAIASQSLRHKMLPFLTSDSKMHVKTAPQSNIQPQNTAQELQDVRVTSSQSSEHVDDESDQEGDTQDDEDDPEEEHDEEEISEEDLEATHYESFPEPSEHSSASEDASPDASDSEDE
jgi:hypothetical protein